MIKDSVSHMINIYTISYPQSASGLGSTAWSICVRLSRKDRFEMQFSGRMLKIVKYGEDHRGQVEEDRNGENIKTIFENGTFQFANKEFKLPEVRVSFFEYEMVNRWQCW